MPLTAEQSYALGTKEGRDRINQQLRANPQYLAFLRSIGVDPSGPIRLSDQQRQMASEWARKTLGSIGGLEIDPSGNLNNPHGFTTELKQWGPIAAAGAGIAAPFVLPALGIGGGGAAGSGVLPSASIPGMHAAVPASIASQGASAGLGGTLAASSIPGLEAAIPAGIASQGVSQTLGTSMPAAVKAIESAGTSALGNQAADAAKGGIGNFLKGLATPENGAALAALIAGLAGSRGSNEPSEETKRIQAIQEAQMRRADPLHRVATNLAFGRMPVNYRQGVQLNNVPLPD